MSTLSAALWIAWKDLRIEARTGEIVVTTVFFAALVAILTSLSFYIDDNTARRIAAGVLWISLAFSGVLAMGRSWAREREQDVLRALLLAPIPRHAIYLGKAIGTLLFLWIVLAVLAPLVGVLYHLDAWTQVAPAWGLLALGSVGFVAAGTLFAAMSVQTRARELVLSIVLFPLVAPALLAGVVATRELFNAAPLSELLGWLRIIVAADVIFVVAGLFLFETLLSD